MMRARIHHLVYIPAETIYLEGALALPAGAHRLVVLVPAQALPASGAPGDRVRR
jgi:hypothetical protein